MFGNDMKSGYLLKIHTNENDVDGSNTTELDGLSEADVRFYIKIANLFGGPNPFNVDYGNHDRYGYKQPEFPIDGPYPDRSAERYRRRDDMMLPVHCKAVVDAHKAEFGSVPGYWDYGKDNEYEFKDSGDYRDWFGDILHDVIGSWADGEYWRYLDGYEVFFVPDPIKNVTEDFK